MEAIRTRKSIRGYEERPVPEEKLRKVLEAARLSPSARNAQDRKFVVVQDAKRRIELSRAANGQAHVAEAPVVIAAVGTRPDYIMRCDVPSYPIDVAIAVDHITLAATEEGLGTCWIGAFSQEQVRETLKIPEQYKVVALLLLGFPRLEGREKTRKPIDEVICYETFVE